MVRLCWNKLTWRGNRRDSRARNHQCMLDICCGFRVTCASRWRRAHGRYYAAPYLPHSMEHACCSFPPHCDCQSTMRSSCGQVVAQTLSNHLDTSVGDGEWIGCWGKAEVSILAPSTDWQVVGGGLLVSGTRHPHRSANLCQSRQPDKIVNARSHAIMSSTQCSVGKAPSTAIA